MKIEEFIWTNRAFIEYGKLRGLETFEQTMADLFEIVAPVSYTHLTLPTNREV